jgi:hypothetical protein
MNRHYNIFKKPSSPSTGKALLNHILFSPSQTGETVPLSPAYRPVGKKKSLAILAVSYPHKELCSFMNYIISTN